jgi:hypothetical protein
MKEAYDYSYNDIIKYMDSDREKKEVVHTHEQIFDSCIQSSFLPKEHQMVRYVSNAVRAFDLCTSCQAEYETRYSKAPGGTKLQHKIDRPKVAMAVVNKAEHIYQVNTHVSGRAIATTQLWSKSTNDRSLKIIAEGLCSAQVSSKNNYFLKRMSQLCVFSGGQKSGTKLKCNSWCSASNYSASGCSILSIQ